MKGNAKALGDTRLNQLRRTRVMPLVSLLSNARALVGVRARPADYILWGYSRDVGREVWVR